MDAILFSTIITIPVGYVYWMMKKRFTPRTIDEIREGNQEARQSPEYRQWRQAVFLRDENRCVWCKSTQNLEADHIYPFAYFPEYRFDVRNGRVLCKPCHEETPTYGYKAKTFYQKVTSYINS